jgi:hypothetical protein
MVRKPGCETSAGSAGSPILRFSGRDFCDEISQGKTDDQGYNQKNYPGQADSPEKQPHGDDLGVLQDDYQKQNRYDQDDSGFGVHKQGSCLVVDL